MNNRRTVLGLLAGAALTLCLSLPAFAPAAVAAEASPARKALEVSISRVLDCIKNPDYVNPATRPPLRRQIEDEVYHIFDFGEFSSRTVGPRWKEFSAAQKKSFSNAFADLLLTTYLNKVDGYNGEQVAYTGEIANAARTRVEVRTEITMKDGTRVPVAYRMMAKDNSWRVYDIIVENLSLVKNYRTQFQDILTSGTPDELIARVRGQGRRSAQAAGRQIAAKRREHASPHPCPAPAADAPVRRARRCRSGRSGHGTRAVEPVRQQQPHHAGRGHLRASLCPRADGRRGFPGRLRQRAPDQHRRPAGALEPLLVRFQRHLLPACRQAGLQLLRDHRPPAHPGRRQKTSMPTSSCPGA